MAATHLYERRCIRPTRIHGAVLVIRPYWERVICDVTPYIEKNSALELYPVDIMHFMFNLHFLY